MKNLTKNLIKETFIKLLNERPITNITVKDIAAECEINRNTFYYHYQDIPAIIEEIVFDEFNKVLQENPTIDSFESGVLALYDFASTNRKAILHIYNSVNRNIFENYLWKLSDNISRIYIDKILENKQIPNDDERILTRLLKSVSVGVALDWINSGMTDDVKEDVHRVCEVASGTFETLVSRANIC